MSRKALMVLTGVFVAFVAVGVAFLVMRSGGDKPVSTVDSTPVVSSTAGVLTQPTATPVFVPTGTALAQPTETAVGATVVSAPTQVPTVEVTAASVSSPTPTSTPLPLVAITTIDISGDNIADLNILGGYSGQEKTLAREKPLEMKDAPQARGVGYYGVFRVGSRGMLAIMADIIDPLPEGFQNPGTLYVGRELNGSLADAYAYSLVQSHAIEVNSYAVDFGEEGDIPTALRIVAEMAQPVSAVSVGIQTVSVRVGRISETDRFFALQERSGYGMFKNLGDVVVLQDLNGDGKVIGDWPETQQSSTVLIEGKWIIHSISPSGRTVYLLSRENAVLAGLIQQ